MSASTIASLVSQLRAASAAYYNGGAPLMDDDTYDAAVERLRELDPTNAFLQEIGAPPAAGAAPLPHPMPSLDKAKLGEDRLRRFLDATPPGGLVLSEKLDGLSALWIPAKEELYLRGDGLVGQDVRFAAAGGIQGLSRKTGGQGEQVAVRGELILPRAAGEPLARAWVNGVLHRKEDAPGLAADLAKIHFVAYELFSPVAMTRSAQFAWLKRAGFELPWYSAVPSATEEALAAALQSRRATGPYDTDGIVVAWNTVPKSECSAGRCRNPKDAVAFKMPLADQSAETTVRGIHWGTSAQGYLIPKLEFDPVVIGSATIQFCTGHNAKTVAEKGVGPGARIVVRRSGDVIPKLDAVLAAVDAAPFFPAAGTYEWDATRTHIRQVEGGGEGAAALAVARLGHFLKGLEIPGAGPATATALVEAGIRGPKALREASSEALAKILGQKTGASLWTNYRSALEKVTEKGLMLASSQMPRGVGDTKLAALFAAGGADPRQWQTKLGEAAVGGWTAGSLEAFWPALDEYLAWRERELVGVGAVAEAAGAPTPTAGAPAPIPTAGILCMTGFRDKALEAAAVAKGYGIAATFTGKVTHLVVPDGPVKESEKTKAAAAKGIPILTRTAFMEQFR